MSGLKNLKKAEILFREGDPSEAMYVIKSGKIAITKAKGASEIVLAELGPGDMLGEMAFFDNRPRSAGARAVVDAVLIELPFKALNAQFKTFPEWLKAIMRTVNNHLRAANSKIKNLERITDEEQEFFPPHLVTRLVAILSLVAERFGEDTIDGCEVPAGKLRNYTIQIFQQPTNKMNAAMELLSKLEYMKVEDLGEGRQRITVFKKDLLVDFVDFYNELLFTSEEKRVNIEFKELKPMKALVHYGRKETPNGKGEVRVNLTKIQAEADAELGFPFSADDVNSLIEKKLTSDKLAKEGSLELTFLLKDFERMQPNWELIHAFRRATREQFAGKD